ncbi:MAG: U32 family peptidase C-terminal domain-containing protein [Clostridium sp.]|nr:MAG: U32 family peptidase C-terminal domain-containing protein [Clostridium sp.]
MMKKSKEATIEQRNKFSVGDTVEVFLDQILVYKKIKYRIYYK